MNCNQGICGDLALKGLVKCTHAGRNQDRPIIACDVDDVVADLLTEWLLRYSTEWNHDLTPAMLKSWQITDHVLPEAKKHIFSYLEDPGLYDDILPFPGALETINELREIGRVIFVTSCEGPINRDHKYRWLQRHGFLAPGHKQGADYITAKDKWLIGADFLIDDGAHNIEAWPRKGLLVSRPHNAAHQLTRGVRLAELSEAPARIKLALGI